MSKKLTVGLQFARQMGIGLPIITSGNSYKKFRYIPYSSDGKYFGKDNLYPQEIARYSTDSPTNGAIIQRKSMMTSGFGFDKNNLPNTLKKVLNDMNKKNQTIDDILEEVAQDYVTFGGFALKVKWYNDGYIGSVERIPFEQVRCGEPDSENNINYYVVCNNWDGTLQLKYEKLYSLPIFNPEYFGKDSISFEGDIPKPTDLQIEQSEQIIYYYNETKAASTSGMLYYPIPDYVSGFDSIQTEIDIITANKAIISNGTNSKTIVSVPLNLTEVEKREFEINFTKRFTSAENNGAPIFIFQEDVSALPIITQIEALDADKYNLLMESTKNSIITSHQIDAILAAVNTGGGFNNRAEEMESAFQIFNKTVISKYQQKLERVFNTVIKYMGWEVDMKIKKFTLVDENTNQSTIVTDGNTEVTSVDSK